MGEGDVCFFGIAIMFPVGDGKQLIFHHFSPIKPPSEKEFAPKVCKFFPVSIEPFSEGRKSIPIGFPTFRL